MRATGCRARPARGARRTGRQALEGGEGDCSKTRKLGGLGMSTPERSGRGRTDGMQEARGRHQDAAGPEVEEVMPVVEDTLGQKGRGGRRGGHQAHGPPTTGWAPDQHQQRPRWWDTGRPADAGDSAGQQDEGRRCGPVCMLDTGGYARHMERVDGVQSEDRSMRGVHHRTRGLATGAVTEGAPVRPISPFGPRPSARRGPEGCEAWLQG